MCLLKDKKGVYAIIAIFLLIFVAFLSVFAFSQWFKSYPVEIFNDVEIKSRDVPRIGGIDKVLYNNLYFVNDYDENITIHAIEYGGHDCEVSMNVSPGVHEIPITACVVNLNKPVNDLVVKTNKNVYVKTFFDERIDTKGTNTIEVGDMIVSFSAGYSCSEGLTKIFGYMNTNNSHVELAGENNYARSLCVGHDTFQISTSCSGTHDRVFYLADTTDSHLYLDTSNAEPGSYNWQEICLESSGGADNVDIVYNTSDMSSLGYACIDSYAPENIDLYGTMYGECFGNLNKIWMKIE